MEKMKIKGVYHPAEDKFEYTINGETITFTTPDIPLLMNAQQCAIKMYKERHGQD